MYTPTQPEIVDSFTYMNEGEYYVGYTVVFGDRSGCEGMTFQGYKWVWYDDRSKSCDVVDDESVSSSEVLLFSLLLPGTFSYFADVTFPFLNPRSLCFFYMIMQSNK